MLRPKPRNATYADIEALPPNMVGEIIHGVLHAMPRPSPRHGIVAGELTAELGLPFSRGRGGPGGWMFIPEPELHLGSNIAVPDLAGWRRERLTPFPQSAFISVAPDWLCEVLSPSTEQHDRTDKLPVYAEHGVNHCWLVDPIKRTLEALALSGGSWQLVTTVKETDSVVAPPFETHSFQLDVLWAPA